MASLNHRLQKAVRMFHLWVGGVAGILFCLMSLSGSLIIFRANIEGTLRPRWVPTSSARPSRALTEAATNIRNRWPGVVITAINVPVNESDPVELDAEIPGGTRSRVFVSRVSGEILGTFDLPWLKWIVDLHHNLRLGATGKALVGVIGICLFLTSATGLTLWLLRQRKLLPSLRVRWKGLSWTQFSYQLHRSIGLWANALLIVISLTGISLAYPDTFQRVLGLQPRIKTPKLKARRERPKTDILEAKPIEDLIDAATQTVAGSKARQIRFAEPTGKLATIRLWMPGDIRPEGDGRITLDPSTGQVVEVDRSLNWPLAKRVLQALKAVHYAEWGGPLIQLVWAFLGLLPPILFVSGGLIWLRPYLARRSVSRSTETVEVGELVS